MSVIVKGMDMPYGCANCPFCSQPVYDAKGHADYFCHVDVEGIRGNAITSEVIRMYEGDTYKTFPDWCPLQEVKHGKWIPVEKYGLHKCSVCKYEYRIEPVESFKFCPNCGARMDG